MSILFSLFTLLFCVILAVVVASHVLARIHYGGRPAMAAPPLGPLATLRLLAAESGCLAITLLLYPFGWLPAPSPRVRSDGHPVLLLHGLFQNRACWYWTAWRLRRAGYGPVQAINLPPWQTIEAHAARLGHAVESLRAASGVAQVDLIGHSMGGILARHYLAQPGQAARVRRCVLLGTPNAGSALAPFAISPLGRLLHPGSSFLSQLAAVPPPAGVQVTAILSRHDNLVLPWDSARLDGADNIELDGIGHTTLLYHPRVFAPLRATLQGA